MQNRSNNPKTMIKEPLQTKDNLRPVGTIRQVQRAKKEAVSAINKINSSIINYMNSLTSFGAGDDLSKDTLLMLLKYVGDTVKSVISNADFISLFENAYRFGFTTALTSAEVQLSDVLNKSVVSENDLNLVLAKAYGDYTPIWNSVIDNLCDYLTTALRSEITSGYRLINSSNKDISLKEYLINARYKKTKKNKNTVIQKIEVRIKDKTGKLGNVIFSTTSNEINSSARSGNVDAFPHIDKEVEWQKNNGNLDISTAIVWESALMATTRPWHAALHGKIVDEKFIQEFYSEDGNRYNCYCLQKPIILQNGEIPPRAKTKYSVELNNYKNGFYKSKTRNPRNMGRDKRRVGSKR